MSCKYLVIKKCMKKRTKTVFSVSISLSPSLSYLCSLQRFRAPSSGKWKNQHILWPAERFNCALGPGSLDSHTHRHWQMQLPDLHTHTHTHTLHTRPVHFAEHKLFDLIESENEFAKCPKRLQSDSPRKPLEWPLGQLATYATCA